MSHFLKTKHEVGEFDSFGAALVVDDREENRILLRRTLSGRRYWVETAVDGEQAWRLVLRRRFGFIVTDYQMPELDGIELIARIRRCPRKRIRRYPIILHSAVDDATVRQAVAQDKDTFYLPKPLDVRRLDEWLRTMRGRRSWFASGRRAAFLRWAFRFGATSNRLGSI